MKNVMRNILVLVLTLSYAAEKAHAQSLQDRIKESELWEAVREKAVDRLYEVYQNGVDTEVSRSVIGPFIGRWEHVYNYAGSGKNNIDHFRLFSDTIASHFNGIHDGEEEKVKVQLENLLLNLGANSEKGNKLSRKIFGRPERNETIDVTSEINDLAFEAAINPWTVRYRGEQTSPKENVADMYEIKDEYNRLHNIGRKRKTAERKLNEAKEKYDNAQKTYDQVKKN